MGEFEGTLTLDGAAVKAEAKVIADEDHKYRIVLLSPPGDAKAKRIELAGTGKDGSVAVSGDWTGSVTKDSLDLAAKSGGKAEMKRVERTSPTLGQKPPAGAIVLLPFEEGKPANQDQWNNKQWVCRGRRQHPDAGEATRRPIATSAATSCTWNSACPSCPPRGGKAGAIAASINTAATRSRCSIRSA